MATIAELLLEQGRQQAEERQRQGDIRGSLWQNLAQIAANYGKQIQQQQIEAPIRAQEAQLRGLQIQQGQGELADRSAARAHDVAFRNAIVGGAPDETLVKMDPERAEKFINGRDAIVKANQSGYADRQKILHDVTLGIDAVPHELKPDAYQQKRKELLASGVIRPQDAPEQFDPQWFQQTLNYARSPEVQANLEKTRAETAKFTGEAAKANAEAAGGHPPTEAALDAAAQAIYSKRNAGTALTPKETSDLKAYEDRKRVVSDPAALAATERQAASIAAQTAQQARAQTFQEQQQGRKELTEKVEQPYQTAASSAQTLRDTVALAKSGNMTAAALQSLETTMAAIRAQGLNRINTAEIGVSANAGSLWDRAQSFLGKAAAGQPIDATLQKDMQQFASMLEKAAYKKYQNGHASITKRYSLTDEKPLPGPTIYARDPQGVLHSAPYGKPIPKGWTED